MVKLSLPSWDRDKSRFQAGTSFTPTLTGRVKPSVSSSPSILRRFKPSDFAAPTHPTGHPLMVLRLSSPSFLDSVVHDGSSDNPLYVIDTNDNVTKVRRSDLKGFVTISCVRWPRDPSRSITRKNKDLTGVEVAFGKGHWRRADDFLGYSYSSLSTYRKFYIPHHKHSLKWKPSGAHYACTTEAVRGPVAILEPAMQRAPPQLKILDPLFRLGNSRPQRMHNGLPLSLLDFLLVTAMMLVTPNDEWMNVTRSNPPESVADPSDGSLSSDMQPLSSPSEATPEIERWRSAILEPVVKDESGDDHSSSSRATSRLSFHSEIQSLTQHTYPSEQGIFSTLSGSSFSLTDHTHSYSQHRRRRTRELPPIPPRGSSAPASASSYVSHVSYPPHDQHEPPPIPPLSSVLSAPPDLRFHVSSPTSVSSSRWIAESPMSSIHSRSLPIPPNSSSSKPPLPLLPLISPPNSPVGTTVVSPLPGPAPSMPHQPHPPPPSHSHADTAGYSESPHDYKSPSVVKAAPPNYPAPGAHIIPTPLPYSAHVPVRQPQGAIMGQSLRIRTTDVAPVLSAGSASAAYSADNASLEVVAVGDPFDMPPAYSSLDVARSSLPLHAASGAVGDR